MSESESEKDAPLEEAPLPPAVVGDDSGDVIFETLWGRVVVGWDDEKVHQAFVEYAVRQRMLPEAAGKYKLLKDDPDRGERAKKKMEAIAMAAMQLLYQMKTPRADKVPAPITFSAFAIALLVFAGITYMFFHRH